MLSTTVTDTGQITLPDEIRQHLRLVSGSRVEFVIDETGQVKIFPLNVAVETLSGILHRPGIRPASLRIWNQPSLRERMIGLDTNILVCYLTRDDEQQWRQAAALIQQSQPCFITNIVLSPPAPPAPQAPKPPPTSFAPWAYPAPSSTAPSASAWANSAATTTCTRPPPSSTKPSRPSTASPPQPMGSQVERLFEKGYPRYNLPLRGGKTVRF